MAGLNVALPLWQKSTTDDAQIEMHSRKETWYSMIYMLTRSRGPPTTLSGPGEKKYYQSLKDSPDPVLRQCYTDTRLEGQRATGVTLSRKAKQRFLDGDEYNVTVSGKTSKQHIRAAHLDIYISKETVKLVDNQCIFVKISLCGKGERHPYGYLSALSSWIQRSRDAIKHFAEVNTWIDRYDGVSWEVIKNTSRRFLRKNAEYEIEKDCYTDGC